MTRQSLLAALCLLAATTAHAGQSPTAVAVRVLETACSLRDWRKDTAVAQLPGCRRVTDSLARTDPLRVGAVDRLALLESVAGNNEAALSLLTSAVDAYPDDITLRLHRMQLIKGTPDAAILRSDVDYLRSHHPEDPRTWLEYGEMLAVYGSHEDAVAAFSAGLKLDPGNVALLQQRAYASEAAGRDAEALADTDALIAAQPGNFRAYLLRAGLALRAGQPERTIADIETIRSFGPSAGDETSLLLAQAQIMNDQPRDALASLDAALSSWPAKSQPDLQRKALIFRLAVLEKLGIREEADATLTRLLQVTRPSHLLRMQVYLRNMGWNEVQITGTVDGATRAALTSCMFLRACGGRAMRAI